jgi:hypothetical protein
MPRMLYKCVTCTRVLMSPIYNEMRLFNVYIEMCVNQINIGDTRYLTRDLPKFDKVKFLVIIMLFSFKIT